MDSEEQMRSRMSRRDFLACLLSLSAGAVFPISAHPVFADSEPKPVKKALHWVTANDPGADCLLCHDPAETRNPKSFTHADGIVRCLLCAQQCILRPGERGRCRARKNQDGVLISLVYGKPVAIHLDPIEKKPFYHFLPGQSAYSIGTAGCPLSCQFCQNWEISQAMPEDIPAVYRSAQRITEEATGRKAPIIAFTYNEPTVFFEYLMDIARLAKEGGIRSVLVSCGFMNPAPLKEMCTALDAIKIDLKGFSPDFYRKHCRAELAPVLRSIRTVSRSGVHLEIVNLVIPGLNDDKRMLSALIQWVADEIGPDVPLHFTRFHPDYQMRNVPPTPVATLETAYEMALKAGLHYPYIGNVPAHPGNHTRCPRCHRIVIERNGFFVLSTHLEGGKCRYCGASVSGVWI
ncbi:AmmeMemoRadiSam system radical SAM enzyme [Desulfatirhabdium butyrativorans]|uniref:AmmeMemoRadiSam system radical SAM enzyme n=1 Tax=Desulfatirhabdium butyrativorans TaxID=340467 RepID=UPI0004222B58|nr:AmmeMemoRadiSam system radical SAM enzyme [Desulfatirhabdium butyrativorans]